MSMKRRRGCSLTTLYERTKDDGSNRQSSERSGRPSSLNKIFKEETMGELTIGVFPSLVGSMSLDFSFRLAEAASAKGHKVNMWLSGNAVMMAKKGQKSF